MGKALNRIIAIPFILMLLVPCAAFSQAADLVSAEKYFAGISAGYQKVKDYDAVITITQGKTTSRGKLSYKSPMYLRIESFVLASLLVTTAMGQTPSAVNQATAPKDEKSVKLPEFVVLGSRIKRTDY